MWDKYSMETLNMKRDIKSEMELGGIWRQLYHK